MAEDLRDHVERILTESLALGFDAHIIATQLTPWACRIRREELERMIQAVAAEKSAVALDVANASTGRRRRRAEAQRWAFGRVIVILKQAVQERG